MTSLALACRLGAVTAPQSIPRRVRAILNKYNATMLLPGVSGAMRFGYQPGNYRESTGQTLAAADQQVGLVVDAARVPGPELVVNGTGDSLVGWEYASVTVSTVGGEFLVSTTATNHNFKYPVAVQPGKTYRFSWTARFGTISSLRYSVYNQTGGANIISPTTYTQGDNAVVFTAPPGCTQAYVYPIRDSGATGSAYFDNISVRELPGIHASQSTSGFQPVLRNTAGIQSWQFDGTDDRLSLSAVPFQTQDSSFAVAAFSPTVMDSALRRVWEIGGNGSSIALTVDSGTFRFLRVGNTGSLVNITAGVFGGAGVSSVVSVVSAGAFSSIRADGLQKASSVIAVEQSTANVASIGNRGAGDRPFLGHIHGVIFGKGAISDAELLTLERFVASLQGRTL